MQLEFTPIIDQITTPKKIIEQQLFLEIEPTTSWTISTINTNSIFLFSPSPSIVFNDQNKECGKFSWADGIFKFEGNVEKSSKIFIDYICKYINIKK